jgi:hypothetical protein
MPLQTAPASGPSQQVYAAAPFCTPTAAYRTSPLLDERAQLRILEQFAERLVTRTITSPQVAIDAINDRFWELI